MTSRPATAPSTTSSRTRAGSPTPPPRNVFRLLKACGLPVAFVEQDSAISFIAPHCRMLPYEVVVRREAHGSYLKRNPQFAKGQLFPRLIVEFFLKTKDRDWKGKPLTCDDPLMSYVEGATQIKLYNPAKPILGQEPFLALPDAGGVRHRRGVEDLSRDAAHRAAGVPGAGEGLAARRRHAGRFQGRVRLRRPGPPVARRRDRQRFLAGDRERLLHRQAGVPRRRRARRRRRQIPARRRDHRATSAFRASASSCGAARPATRPTRSRTRSASLPT